MTMTFSDMVTTYRARSKMTKTALAKRLGVSPGYMRIKKKAGVPDIGWHTFRHSFASNLVMSGVDIVTVGKLLGHADIATTFLSILHYFFR